VTEQPEKKKARPRSRAEADALAAEYEASGVSRQEFCQQRQVALKTLARYLVQHRKRHAAVSPMPRSRLLRVQVEPPSGADSERSVVLATGRRIAVKPGFDAELLRQLLAVLEQT
jgi:hypothetical protein